MGIANAGRKPPSCMATLLYCDRGGCARLILLPLVGLLQRIQNAAALRQWRCRRRRSCRLRLRGRRGGVDDRTRLAVVAGDPRQHQAGQEEAHRQHRCGAGQEIGGTAARHEAGAAADAEAAAFGFLQQHRRDQGRNQHQVNYDNDSLHLYLPSQTKSADGRLLTWLAGFFEVARCYTIARGIVTPARCSRDIMVLACIATRPTTTEHRSPIRSALASVRISTIIDEWIL